MNSIIMFWKQGVNDIKQLLIAPLMKISFYKKCALLILLGVCLYIPFMNSYNATHDEQAAMLLFSYPWSDMFKLIAVEDGHPPLYHIIYRLFQLGGDFHNIFPLRVATLCFFVLTALLGVFPLRRLLGEIAALFFITCVFFLPSALWLSVNVRMYPLALYVVCGAFIYSQLMVFDNKKTDWLFFALFTIAGLYTHYFCCITLVLIWCVVFIQFLVRKQYEKIFHLTGLGIVVSLMYLPWIFAFLQQYDNMKTTWFPNVLQRDMAIYGAFFQLRGLDNPILECLFYFFGVFCWVLIWEYLIEKKRDKKTIVSRNAVLVFWGLFLVTFIISVYIRPTLHDRFLIVIIGLLYTAVSGALQYYKKFRSIFIVLLSISYVLGYMKYYAIANDGGIKEYVSEFRKKIPTNSLLIYTDTCTNLFADFYLPEYKKAFAPLEAYILLFQDRVLRERENNTDLDKYDHIYLLRRHMVSAQARKYFADELGYNESVILYLQNNYSGEGMTVREISKENASNMLKKSEVFLKESLH